MKPMFTMTGTVTNVYVQPKGTNKSGDEYGGNTKVQILGRIPLPNGEVRMDMISLTAHDPNQFDGLTGIEVTIPVGMMALGKNQLIYFIPKGSKVEH